MTKRLRVLGISCFGAHDAGLALLTEEGIAFASEEERFSRRKHDNRFPRGALRCALETLDIPISEIEHVGFYSDLSSIPWGGVRHLFRYFPRSLGLLRRAPNLLEHRSIERVLTALGYRGAVHGFKHHLCHAASVFYPSPFEEAAILTIDGTGEWTTTGFFLGKGRSITPLGEIRFPHSLGRLYETVTQFLGFPPHDGEGTVMGLAALGTPRFLDLFRRIVRTLPDGTFRLDLRYFDFPYGGKRRYSRRFVEAFGEPRPPGGPVTQRDRDLAASLQACLEETVLHLCRHLARRTGASKLCLAGGVALNSQMNARILASGIFEELFILPAAGDPGTALGAALLAAYHVAGVRRSFPLVTPFLGPAYEKARCRAALSQAGLPFREVADAPAEAARLLAAGKIVGWFQERLEFGPRALGNRSILADPRDPAMKARLNARIKGREPFRPFAPAILAERVSEFFVRPTLSPYMLLVETIRPEKRGLIPAVVHHDGTGRLQTVSRRDNPRFYALISAFANRTGIPLLLNTSFNRKGEPIVCTPEDAIATFRAAGLDALFLGDLCVEREE